MSIIVLQTSPNNAYRWSLRADMIISQTEVFPDAVPPATPRIKGGFLSFLSFSSTRHWNEQVYSLRLQRTNLPSSWFPYQVQRMRASLLLKNRATRRRRSEGRITSPRSRLLVPSTWGEGKKRRTSAIGFEEISQIKPAFNTAISVRIWLGFWIVWFFFL